MASQQGVETVEEYDYEDLQGVPLSTSMLAGSLAGISEHAVMYPVDVVRVSVESSYAFMPSLFVHERDADTDPAPAPTHLLLLACTDPNANSRKPDSSSIYIRPGCSFDNPV